MRIIPVSSSLRTVCMRVELHGCVYRGTVAESSAQGRLNFAGLLESYSMQDGMVADGLNLTDFRFDGRRKENRLREGLGQRVFSHFLQKK